MNCFEMILNEVLIRVNFSLLGLYHLLLSEIVLPIIHNSIDESILSLMALNFGLEVAGWNTRK